MKRLLVSLVVVSGALLESAAVRATCCSADADCPKGFACYGGACTSDFVGCTCDADCGPNLYCLPFTSTVCTQMPGGGQDCHPQGQCVSAWQRPCFSTADCGPGGFTCGMSGGTLCSSAGCQTTTACMPPALPTTCATDADCPAAWTCEPGTVVTTSCIPIRESCPSNGCPPPSSAKGCVPPLFDLVGPPRFSGVPTATSDSCPAKSGSGGGPGALGTGGAGGAAPSANTPGTGGTLGASSGVGGAGTLPRAAGSTSSGTGCQIAPFGPASSPLFLAALGLLGACRRRTAKR